VSLRSVQRIWAAHKLQPHRVRTFKRSRDPAFLAKLAAIVGLYMVPPRHAVVLSLDEKSRIQALDRTQPGLPMKPGKCEIMTHDYKRNGTTTLATGRPPRPARGAPPGRTPASGRRHAAEAAVAVSVASDLRLPPGPTRRGRRLASW